MGVVNVTPDSFSDGGQWFDHDVAAAHARHLIAQGADLVDIGGESTRPGAGRVTAAEELDRVLPVVRELVTEGIAVSVDTMRGAVAEAALDAGATFINDVSGGQADPHMAAVVADRGCDYVLSHWRGHSDVMTRLAQYQDVVGEVRSELMAQVEMLTAAGVQPGQIILDPGLGFAKDAGANWEILAHIHELMAEGFRVLVGASRKRFLGELLASQGAESLPLFRDRATAAVTALMAEQGVWAVRVHEVMASVDAIRVAVAIRQAKAGRNQGSVEERT